MMIAVLDANIAVALHARLAYSENAEKAVRKATQLLAPDLIIAETANTFWKITRADISMLFHARKSMALIIAMFDKLIDTNTLADQAFMLAVEHNHPAYDCFYLAAAGQANASLVTADKKLHAIAHRVGIPSLFVTA